MTKKNSMQLPEKRSLLKLFVKEKFIANFLPHGIVMKNEQFNTTQDSEISYHV